VNIVLYSWPANTNEFYYCRSVNCIDFEFMCFPILKIDFFRVQQKKSLALKLYKYTYYIKSFKYYYNGIMAMSFKGNVLIFLATKGRSNFWRTSHTTSFLNYHSKYSEFLSSLAHFSLFFSLFIEMSSRKTDYSKCGMHTSIASDINLHQTY
jgi:hypothetical protein